MHRRLGLVASGVASLTIVVVLISGLLQSTGAEVGSGAETTLSTTPGATTTIGTPGTTDTTTTPNTSVAAPPALEPRYVVPEGEVEPEAKQLAADIAYSLTTYEESDDATTRFSSIAGLTGVELLAEAGEPLTHRGRWSRGLVLYPQLGGLTNERVSVMVVIRQTVGQGSDPEFSVVRTLDIRLIRGEVGWEFEALASAGGAFDSIEDLALAGAVAADPRIEMPDSARLDILGGEISPILLEIMSELADIASYGVTVMATGHPYHVFETGRVSHHTLGRAIDINRVGDRHVIDDRDPDSRTRAFLQWVWEDPRVIQVGAPWDVDGSGRSFTNLVHQDHIHLAVIGRNDPDWVPAIGNRVWEDLDADGLQDSGEPGMGGVTVRLFSDSDNEVASTVTDGVGVYEFLNLSYGEWHVEVDLPSGGFFVSPRDQGSDDAADSDIAASGVMATTTLDPREDDRRWDAGFYRRASIGDRVWNDLDGDGVQEPGEPGVGGVTVRLFNGAGVEVGSTATSADGVYGFSNLTPGDYHVAVTIPGGYVATPRDQGGDTTDSDIDSGGDMALTSLQSAESDQSWDAGLVRPASIGDLVWDDLNADGLQDPGELGIAGITVRLFNEGGAEVRSTVTEADGSFTFSNLRPGTYHIEVDIPDGFVSSPQDIGPDDAVDSDIDIDGVMVSTTLAPGEDDDGWDAGLHPGP